MIKIMIADDDNVKYQRIADSINQVFENKVEIITADNIISTKRKLLENHFDLLILDLNMPLDEESSCKDEAGLELLREIQKVSNYNMPQNIILCTAHKYLITEFDSLKNKSLYSLIEYSASSENWIKPLHDRILDIIRSKEAESTSILNYDYDLAIVTAVKIEMESVHKIIECIEENKYSDDSTSYYTGSITVNEKNLKVVTANQNQMGMVAASNLCSKIINRFKPKYLAMVGIAAGKKDKGNYGDIIAATQIWDYSSGKFALQGDSSVFLPEPHFVTLDIDIRESLLQRFEIDLKTIMNDWPGKRIPHELNLIVGSMACGPAVIQNEDIVREYIDPHDRSVKGIDMESYGVLYTAENCQIPRPKAIVFKSICDFADKEKNDEYQEYAAYTSCQFLKCFLSRLKY